MKIVGIGGGTGLPVLLRGLKELHDRREEEIDITAIVTVSDSGGSTGILRGAFGMPGMGDIRNSVIALSSDSRLAEVCGHRFYGANGLAGHSVGNLVLAALYEMGGGFAHAVRLACELFEVEGRVLPCTEMPINLCAVYDDGTLAEGEANIPRTDAKLSRVWLTPSAPPAAEGVLEALTRADAIVLGPGSLYTSVIPNLLVAGVSDAIAESPAVKIYVCNLMTQCGETARFSAMDHLRTIQSYLPPNAIDACVLNTETIGNGLAERYLNSGSDLIEFNPEVEQDIHRCGVVPVASPLLKSGEVKVRHDSIALARLVVSITRGALNGQDTTVRRTELGVTCAESSDISVPEKSQVY